MRASYRLAKASVPPTIRTILRADGPSGSASPVTAHGWLKTLRVHKNVAFGEIDDGTSNVQGVWKGKGRADGLSLGTSVAVTGSLQASKGSEQDLELVVDHTQILGQCDPEIYPIQKKSLPPAYLRDYAHLRFRTAQTGALMRVRDALMRDWHDWFEDNEFTHIHTPILTSSDCEGAGEVFTLAYHAVAHPDVRTSMDAGPSSSSPPSPHTPTPTPFFPHPVNLTVSSQLHLEPPTQALSRIYTLSPSFRAEPSLTSRHLSEFYMLEAELAFVSTLDSLLDVVEAGIQETLKRLLFDSSPRNSRCRDDLAIIAVSLADASGSSGYGGVGMDFDIRGEQPNMIHLLNTSSKPFTRITYTAAIDLLLHEHQDGEMEFANPPVWGNGLSTEDEKWLASHFNGPVFVTHYPKSLKPFYMLPSDADPDFISPGHASHAASESTVACFDLLFPGVGEMAGGSLREHRLDYLEAAIQDKGMDPKGYEWYLDLRRYGSVPHGGWGMGWERWICWVTGVSNVRDVVAYPRWKGNCKY